MARSSTRDPAVPRALNGRRRTVDGRMFQASGSTRGTGTSESLGLVAPGSRNGTAPGERRDSADALGRSKDEGGTARTGRKPGLPQHDRSVAEVRGSERLPAHLAAPNAVQADSDG